MISTTVGAVVDLVADLLLIPFMGVAGAALGTMIAEVAVLAVQAVTIRRLRVKLAEGKSILRIAAVTLAATVELFFLRQAALPELVRVLLSAFLFFGTVYGALLLLKDPTLTEILEWLQDWIRPQRDS